MQGQKILDICERLGTKNPSLGSFELCVVAIGMMKNGSVKKEDLDEYYLSEESKVFDEIATGGIRGVIVREYPNGEVEKPNVKNLFHNF